MVTSTARVPTKFALEYAVALNREFSSDLSPSTGAPSSAETAMSTVRGKLEASDEYLDITIVATSISKTTLLEAEIADCLDRLAWGEDLQYRWNRTADEAAASAANLCTPRPVLFSQSCVRTL